MRRLRKLFPVVLCLAMVLSLSGVAAAQSGSTVQTESSVACVDGTYYYDTLSDAIKAIDGEGTVELVADVKLANRIIVENGQNITLDLGTYTVSASEEYSFGRQVLITNRGTLTVKGEGTIEATGELYPNHAIESEGGVLNIESGNIVANWNGIRALRGCVVNISGGSISNIDTAANNEDSALLLSKDVSTTISGNARLTGYNTAVRSNGGDITISEDAYLTGKFGIMLFNSPGENTEDASHSHLTMTGGTVEATYGFALSGNNLMSAMCSAEITGGTLTSTAEGTGIYWPMEGELTIGGKAVVEGGTGIEAKMGTITIKDSATVTGTGEYLEGIPEGGGSQAEGSAVLASAQMYGASEGQYIISPDLTVNITSGTLTGTNGNAVTVYNTEDTEEQTAQINVTGGELIAADNKAGVKVIAEKGANETQLVQGTEDNSFVASSSETKVTVSSDAALAAVDSNGQVSYYADVNDALSANEAAAADPVNIYVLGDSQVDSEALKNQNVKLTTAKGVELDVNSDVDGMIVKETVNADGSKTYELVSGSELAAPEVTVAADKTSVHAGETITLTAVADHEEQGVTYSYAWYKDGQLLAEQTSDTLKVTESGIYTVKVTATKTDGDVTLTSEAAESTGITCTVEPHRYDGAWKNDENSHWQECDCGQKGNEAAHEFGQWVVTKEATASEQGSREKACQVCGYTVTEVISATGSDDVPKTGDENNIVLWAAMMMISSAACAGIMAKRRRSEK
ncbi:MAG: PKD domain-containing protein [Anaerovoracaceae bacterium]